MGLRALCPGTLLAATQQAQAATPEQRAADLVAQMTSAEKVDLIATGTAGVPRLGIPPLSARDGPNGIGTGERGVTAFPNAVNIGASWDRGLARHFGQALGQELRAKGFDWFFAPTVEVLRTPLWGRAAETYGEDPFLNGALVAPEISGVQSQHVMAQVKHWVGNTQETGRVGIPLVGPGVDDRVSLRALNEIYLPGFKSAVRKGGAASVMCSYNRINGLQSCQDPFTLGIVRNWMRGFVGPDAVLAVRDGATAANAGTDNFQIGGSSSFRSAANSGQIPQARIDDAARRILTGMLRVGLLDHPVGGAQPVASTPRHRKLATKISAQASCSAAEPPPPAAVLIADPLDRGDRVRRRPGNADRGGRLPCGVARRQGDHAAGGDPQAGRSRHQREVRAGNPRRRLPAGGSRQRVDPFVGIGSGPIRDLLLG